MSDSEPTKMSRRTLLVGAAMSGAFHALAEDTVQATDSAPAKLKICVFSKHLQWTSVAEAAAIARLACPPVGCHAVMYGACRRA